MSFWSAMRQSGGRYVGKGWGRPRVWVPYKRPGFNMKRASGGRARRASQYRSRWGNVIQNGRVRTGGFYGRYSHQHSKPELKFRDLNTVLAPVPTGGSIANVSLLLIAAGSGESQRIGRKIVVKKVSIKLEWIFLATATSGAAHALGRFILYVDKQANGAAATVADILDTPALGVLAFRDLENVNRFKILADRSYNVTPNCGAGDGTTNIYTGGYTNDEIHVNLNLPVEYSDPVGVLTEIKSNNIGILLISHGGNVSCRYRTRVRFEG